MSEILSRRIAGELDVRPAQVAAAVGLLDNGATVPFIARYRKEATGGLDDTQLRRLEERLHYLRELEARRQTVLAEIEAQGALSEPLRAAIEAAGTKQRLEDLYLPYRRKRRTRAAIAREAGLEPLLDALLADPTRDPETLAGRYVDAGRGVNSAEEALAGARHILAERAAEDADLVARLRQRLWDEGVLHAEGLPDAGEQAAKYADYLDYREPVRRIPSHRALAMLRGRREGVLALRLRLPDEPAGSDGTGAGERLVAAHFGVQDRGRPADAWLQDAVRRAWRAKLLVRIETDLLGRLREAAEQEAIRVFAGNLQDLLLAAPAGPKAVLGIDPGLRTGCKLAVVDATGRLLATDTIHPHAPQRQWDAARARLEALIRAHDVALVAVGNGTASRETEQLAQSLRGSGPGGGPATVMVSEAGASVYSASATAAAEFPDLDVSLRGAVSIARRLQDPLAELVKIEPQAIGVGQYQHDVAQSALTRALDAVVEDCVNAVGVDLNTASAALLTRVSGLSATLARRIVEHREQHGPFRRRRDLLAVPRFGERSFEQAAGFLRIRDGDEPLDGSAVHPEAYPLVARIAREIGRPVQRLIGDGATLRTLDPARFTDERFGTPTVTDILAELEKPGRDPRPEFRTARFRDDVTTLADLEPGMRLEGVVTNVTNFGAFIDIGVHQDGLAHISELADHFVKDPRSVCRPGQVVSVRVLEVDAKRRRIALSLRAPRSEGSPGRQPENRPARTAKRDGKPAQRKPEPEARETALAAAFARSRRGE
ncbi:Tex family protein [Sediminicurvatus halobius]|uniref:RNA-binding transcriptional accessory protein n=1 Tax=Sediminicurvatus halobius TaxID=2182432 RepID=A0A2U2N799_9GAMM|nr:Tex family protein [Spiribacter halobius]PWG64967.1 RNA-binding transcriptional accessory protein [Spiribacter halobius]UEX78175.1 RNA-binding transcriptional accessory protein [Spiribacter halobius]